jgi:hypothetical protein
MDLDPAATTASAPKRSRAKGKNTPAAATTATLRARKSKNASTQEMTQVAPAAIEVTSITADTRPDETTLLQMIATAAYYLAEQRQFEPGHELEDWTEAERQIRALYG